jgi:hypothetical protein
MRRFLRTAPVPDTACGELKDLAHRTLNRSRNRVIYVVPDAAKRRAGNQSSSRNVFARGLK